MSAPLRRRKAKPGIISFRLTVEAQEMIVSYQPEWMEGLGHFEFRSPHEPPRRIPVSETGYRSHFADMTEIDFYGGPEGFAREYALRRLRRPYDLGDKRQLTIF